MADIQIAIIGTPIAGKTVFASVWAIRMSDKGENNSLAKKRGYVSLNTNDSAATFQIAGGDKIHWTTYKYVDAYFRFLQSGPDDWIAPTLTGIRPQLSMTYHLGLKAYDIKMIDPPGHDLKTFFSPQGQNDTEDFLTDYVNNSTFIFLVINLRDFFQHAVQKDGENTSYAVTDTVEMYLQALEKLQKLANSEKKKRHVAVLWTAWKEYETRVNELGGINKFLKSLDLHELHNRIHASDTYFEIKEFSVDPVADTRPKKHDVSEKPLLLPQKGFTSYNLELPSEWLANIILDIETKKTTEDERAKSAKNLTDYGLIIFDRNPKEAFASFSKAIELDSRYAHAYNCLGVCYWDGRGIQPNRPKALTLFKRAVALGSPTASNNLQKLDKEFPGDVKECELAELHKVIAKVKMLIPKAEAEIEDAKNNADIQVKKVETDANVRVAHAEAEANARAADAEANADARAAIAEANAEERAAIAEANAIAQIQQAENEKEIVAGERDKVKKQLTKRNKWCIILLVLLLILLAIAGYFACELYGKSNKHTSMQHCEEQKIGKPKSGCSINLQISEQINNFRNTKGVPKEHFAQFYRTTTPF